MALYYFTGLVASTAVRPRKRYAPHREGRDNMYGIHAKNKIVGRMIPFLYLSVLVQAHHEATLPGPPVKLN